MSKKTFLTKLFLGIFLLLICTTSNIYAQEEMQPPQEETQLTQEETLEATIVEILEEKEITVMEQDQIYQKLKLLVTKGSLKGKNIYIENGDLPMANVQVYQVGDRVMVNLGQDYQGNDYYVIADYVRRKPLLILLFIFIVLVILVGRMWGVASLISMGFTFFIIIKLILPQLLAGTDPVFTAIIGSLFIIPVTFYLSHGINKKTSVAIVGTIISLVITGILASIFVEAAKLTGFSSEEAAFLQVDMQGLVNIKGLLLAGIIIGTLGVLDDVTVSQASIVNQLKQANKKISFTDLYQRAMRVGQDHISSMVNTLFLVYAGASLPLLLLFLNSPRPFSQVINYEIIAVEIVRTLVGSIGLILAVPITTMIATSYMKQDR